MFKSLQSHVSILKMPSDILFCALGFLIRINSFCGQFGQLSTLEKEYINPETPEYWRLKNKLASTEDEFDFEIVG